MGREKTEGGSGGKRGHSNMSHWTYTEEIKARSRQLRRADDKRRAAEDLADTHDPVAPELSADKLPADQPPADQPPTDQPPTDQPPTDQPPTDRSAFSAKEAPSCNSPSN